MAKTTGNDSSKDQYLDLKISSGLHPIYPEIPGSRPAIKRIIGQALDFMRWSHRSDSDGSAPKCGLPALWAGGYCAARQWRQPGPKAASR